ncbi:MAG: UDP-N-acetylmuramate--alanine ligase [Bacteroidales bacterium]
MKRIHLISVGDSRLCELAIALKAKGHQVTCSGADIMESEREKLKKHDLLPAQEGWWPEVLDKEYDYVIPANDLSIDNPELQRAKELNLLVLSFPEYIFHRFKNKSRMLVGGSKGKDSIIEMVYYALRKNNLLFDYVFSEGINNDPALNWSYDARMAILEDDTTFSPFIKKQINEYYRPHIFVLSDITREKEEQTDAEYILTLKRMISSIERDGKFIYKQNEPLLAELAESVREDITAMPFGEHTIKETEEGIFLASRFGDFKVNRKNPVFLENLNAARIACRQLGLQDKDFYEAISEYSFL